MIRHILYPRPLHLSARFKANSLTQENSDSVTFAHPPFRIKWAKCLSEKLYSLFF